MFCITWIEKLKKLFSFWVNDDEGPKFHMLHVTESHKSICTQSPNNTKKCIFRATNLEINLLSISFLAAAALLQILFVLHND